MQAMHLLSGGAAQGLVRALQASFEASSGLTLECTFSAVGAMRQKLLDGAPCDVVVLTRPLIDALTASGHVDPATARDLGVVKTGVAVKTGSPHPPVHDADALRAALRAASALYFPDPQLSTAGIHVMKVIGALAIADELAARLKAYPNGNTAMAAMATGTDTHAIGITQVTEIIITPGVELTGDLPREFELATVYTAAVCTRAANPGAAADFIELMAGDALAAMRAKAGFLPVP